LGKYDREHAIFSFMKVPVFALLAAGAAAAQAAENSFTITTGADYSSGRYGDPVATETWAYPFVLKYEAGPYTWKASVPFVQSRGPANVVGVGADRVVTNQPPGAARSVAGWGDTVGSLAWSFYQDTTGAAGLDLTGKVKLATGDKDKGLSTGKRDYALHLDGYKVFGSVTALATVGKKFMGDPAGIDYRDPAYASVGVAHRLSSSTSWGGMYDWRAKVTSSGAPVREAMLFVSHRISAEFKLQAYVVKGYSDASPDRGGGVMLGYGF
jgi:hypothetical protein